MSAIHLSSVRRLDVGRWPGVDAARGLAVVLMVVDHLLVVLQASGRLSAGAAEVVNVLRYSVTRASLPLFMLCSGSVLGRRRNLSRVGNLAIVAVVVNVLLMAYPIGIRVPEILAVWVCVSLFGRWIWAYPVLAGSVGVVQVYAWPIEWGGYQPGVLLVCMALGVLAGPACLEWGARLPGWLRSIGRRPVGWYCGHLLALAGLFALLT